MLHTIKFLLVSLSLHSAVKFVCTAAEQTEAAQLDEQVIELRSRIALEDNPSAYLHLQLATTLHRLNHLKPDGGRRVPEAEKAYRAALDAIGRQNAAPYINVQGNLGALLLSGNQPEAAVVELRQAQELAEQQRQPLNQHAGLTFNLGKALTTVGQLAEAETTYAAAASAAYGHDFASYSKALAAKRNIEPAAAEQAVQVAAAARQHFGNVQQLAFLRDCRPSDVTGQVEIGQQEWIQQADSVELVWLHFALFNYYHHNKMPDLAWQYLELGNKIMSALVPHNSTVELNNLRHIKAIFTSPIPTGGLEDDTPIFVVGMPRSGSTLVEQMLASHSQVFAAGEDTALAPLTGELNKLLVQPQVDHQKVLRKFGRRYIKLMRQRVPLDSHWPKAGPQQIVDKMLRNLWLVGYIQMLVPKSCIVHVARHPMDVALSCYAQPFGYSAASLSWAWDLGSIAQQLQFSWELLKHWEAQLPGRVHTVLYEDLVAHPRAVARELLAVCGLGWEDGVLQFQATDRPVHTASMVQVRQPLYNSSVARWRVYERQLAFLQQRLQPLIDEYEQLLQQYVEKHEADDARTMKPVDAFAVHPDVYSAAQNQATTVSGDSSKDEL